MTATDLSPSGLIAHPAEDIGYGARSIVATGEDGMDWNAGTPDALKTLSPVDLDNKISAMLAATASLKSQPLPASPQLSTSVSRTLSSMGRQPVEAFQALKKTKTRKMFKEVAPEPESRSLSPAESRAEESISIPEQLTTIELRLNEGNNLNRKKVQKIIGGSIKRKPVNCQSQPVRQSVVDAYHGSNGQIDSRPDIPGDYGPTCRGDPFEEETSFEDNLSDGLLSECPTGSSTPRTVASTTRLHRIDEIDDDASVYSKTDHETLLAEELNCGFHTMTPYAGAAATETHGHRRVKKHPSPSKKALEDLEVAFAIYAKLKPLEGGDEVDELARDAHTALSVSDHNKAMRHQTKKTVAKSSHHANRSEKYRIRHGLPFRAGLIKKYDFDELGE